MAPNWGVLANSVPGCWQKSTRSGRDLLHVIALHSPHALLETGLRLGPPEKRRDIDATPSRAVRSLQSGSSSKNREIRACFAHFAENGGRNSMQSRLRGGGRSLLRTLLRQLSLLTGKNTGNFFNLLIKIDPWCADQPCFSSTYSDSIVNRNREVSGK